MKRKNWIFCTILICLISNNIYGQIEMKQFMHDDSLRKYFTYVPPLNPNQDLFPLVIGLHGTSSDGLSFIFIAELPPKADEEQFIVACPNGLDFGEYTYFNCGGGFEQLTDSTDDVGFISRIIDSMIMNYPIDTTRIYAMGHSNGSAMSYRMAAEVSHRIAAIGANSGQMTLESCDPEFPVPILHMHGLSDNLIPYEGSDIIPHVDSVIAIWREVNDCDSIHDTIYNQPGIIGKRWNSYSGATDIELYTIQEGGHQWPKETTLDIQATNVFWDFLIQHTRGGLPHDWNYTETDSLHIISIPVSSNPMVFGTPLTPGDYIGLFYIDDNGKESCGGAIRWNGTENVNLKAFGDDINTPEKDGFYSQEAFIWKVYSWSNFSEYYADPEYSILFDNDGKFHNSGFSRLTSLDVNSLAFDINVILEGPYEGTNMKTSLNLSGLLPLSQPYNHPPWNYSGTEQVISIPDLNIVDWMLVELRDLSKGTNQKAVVAQMAAFLLDNGKITLLNGSSLLRFEISPVSIVYPVIYHRNHLAVMSADASILKYGKYTVDLTNSDNVFGGTAGVIEIDNGIWGMIGGNGKADVTINIDDKTTAWSNNAGIEGYNYGDFNMDSQVDNLDKDDVWLPNLGKATQVP